LLLRRCERSRRGKGLCWKRQKKIVCLTNLKLLRTDKREEIVAGYRLPDGRVLELGPERFRAAEALFRPDLLGLEWPGLHELVAASIKRFSFLVFSGPCLMWFFKELMWIFVPPCGKRSIWLEEQQCCLESVSKNKRGDNLSVNVTYEGDRLLSELRSLAPASDVRESFWLFMFLLTVFGRCTFEFSLQKRESSLLGSAGRSCRICPPFRKCGFPRLSIRKKVPMW
jgi:hypothetical protein